MTTYALTAADGTGSSVDKGTLAVLLRSVAVHYEDSFDRQSAADLMSKFMVSPTITVSRGELLMLALWADKLLSQLSDGTPGYDRVQRISTVARGLIVTATITL